MAVEGTESYLGATNDRIIHFVQALPEYQKFLQERFLRISERRLPRRITESSQTLNLDVHLAFKLKVKAASELF